jgi:outer membrane lipoprotein SlyB
MNTFPEEYSNVEVWMNKYEKVETTIKKGESKTIQIKQKDEIVGELTLSRK